MCFQHGNLCDGRHSPMPSLFENAQAARNVFSAREFVWWYNGHPDGRHLPVDLRGVTSVAVCGIGR